MASSLYSLNTSFKWFKDPQPPEIIIGFSIISYKEFIISRSKPCFVPSWSIEVNNISPQSFSWIIFIHSTIFIFVLSLPQNLYGSQRLSDIFFASIDDTMVDDPNSFDACFIKFGSSRALELIAT